MKLKEILAKNIAQLMAGNHTLTSHALIAKAATAAGHKISARAVGYALDLTQNAKNREASLRTLAGLGAAFKVPPWLLLCPDFDARRKQLRDLPPDDILALAYKLQANRDLLLGILDTPGVQTTPVAAEPESGYNAKSKPATQ